MLTRVYYVLRNRCPALETIERSSKSISNFLGPQPYLPLNEACRLGTIDLLDWIWAASCTSAESRTPGWSLMNFLRSDPDYYRWQFSKSLQEAAERGDLKIAKWLFTHFSGCEASRDVVGAAVSRGHLHILRFLWDHRSGLGEDHAIVDKISNADTAALQRSCTVQFDDSCSLENWGRHAIEAAVDNGELIECLNDGMPLGDGDRQSAIECALQKGYLQFAEELLNPTKRCISTYHAGRAHPEAIETMFDVWYSHLGETLVAAAMCGLAKSGTLELMQQLYQLYSPLQEDQNVWEDAWRGGLYWACDCGSLPVIHWLMEHPLGRETCYNLVNNPESRGCDRLLRVVAEGSIDVMGYFYDHGYFNGKLWVIEEIIQNGKLDSVRWCVDHDLILTPRQFSFVVDKAAEYGRLDILEYIKTLGATRGYEATGIKRKRSGTYVAWYPGTRDRLRLAAEGGNVAAFEWLQENCDLNNSKDAMEIAAIRGHLDALKWLHANRTERCWPHMLHSVVEEGHFETVKWLFEQQPELRTDETILKAINCGHLAIAYWLSKKCPRYRVDNSKLTRCICSSF
ncbi:unnamed protein product [Phytophthora lilii]|uniref:Unnamed protein product n=1 Tax=Phytophthora lilii TaxID=2077276 RepID=A0A9W6X1W8_9STRA|nr:unnamed protein product [Phytophthora lilii]